MSEPVHVAIHSVESGKLIAGPIFLNVLPRQKDILRIDSVYHQVALIEVDYKTQNAAKAYVQTIGEESTFLSMLRPLSAK